MILRRIAAPRTNWPLYGLGSRVDKAGERMDRRRFIGSIVGTLLAGRAAAQVEPTVKGSRDDLRGAKRVFVDTSFDHSLNEAVTAEIKAQLPELELASEADGADLVVRCSRGMTDASAPDPFDEP